MGVVVVQRSGSVASGADWIVGLVHCRRQMYLKDKPKDTESEEPERKETKGYQRKPGISPALVKVARTAQLG